MATLEAGKRLALANKESLIAGAPVVQKARRTPGAEIVPVDSEHCALHQCLASVQGTTDVARLLLTASGGPFRGWTAERLRHGHRGRRAGPPDVVDGTEDHHRLVDADEQGPRGDRGPRALRRRLRPDRHRGAPAVDRALHGGAARRVDAGPAVRTRHAPPHRLRPRLARPRRGALRRARLVAARRASPSSRPTARSSAASTWPTRRAVAAAPPRPGSARPTRSRSRRSSTAALAVERHRRRGGRDAGRRGWTTTSTRWKAVLAADAEARARARADRGPPSGRWGRPVALALP